MEQIEATVDSTVFRSEESSYSVLSVKIGKREHTVVGALPMLSPGEQAVFTGVWVEHPRFGRQFKAERVEVKKPTTLLGIERYLGSGLIRGIGPSTARAIVSVFGEETLEVLSEHPERLQEVPGMGKKRWKQVAENFKEQNAQRDALIFLQSYGLTSTLAVKVAKQYGERTREVVQHNPYQLCRDIDGVGFQTADRIAMALGLPQQSPYRIQAALKYVLQDAAAGQGHIYLPREDMIRRAAVLLGLENEACERELDALTIARDITRRTGEDGQERVYLPAYERAEREVALRLCELLAAHAAQRQLGTEMAIEGFERANSIRFSPRQKEAIAAALDNGVLVITGGPGTGKTTIINCILYLLHSLGTVLLCAPTGRAAKRMSEATGYEAKTIHRLLEFGGEDGSFARNADHPLETDCVIVDETSMVDLMLMRSLLSAIEPGTRLILVGDSDQLPSVGAGNVLADILASGVVPSAHLTDIFRQSEASRIVVNAHRINRGEMPLLNEKGTDFFFERCTVPSAAASTIVSLAASRLPRYIGCSPQNRMRDIQVLAPQKKGDCGVLALNALLQEELNPPAKEKPCLQWGETTFRLGDKVMQTKNDYDLAWQKCHSTADEHGQGVFNGDVGFVVDVDTEERELTVRFDDDRDAVYDSESLENLDLAYALSVHKSQGSEFPVVVMPVVGGPPMLLTRNLFYTALTRARQLVVLVGREEVIRQMVENNHIARRYTSLAAQLAQTARMLMLEVEE